MIVERGAEGVALVMVARNDEQRCRQFAEDLAQPAVFLRLSALDEVSRRDDHVRSRVERLERGDATPQRARRVHHVMQQLALGPDMRVRDLGDQHDAMLRALSATSVALVGSSLDVLEGNSLSMRTTGTV